MPFRVKLATSTEELDGLFRLRHQIFALEKQYVAPTRDGRLTDRFDAFPTTSNVIALVGDEVVAGLRLVEPGEVGMPADDYFDFEAHRPAGSDDRPARTGSFSMLVIDRAHRRKGMVIALLGVAHLRAVACGLTHIVAPLAPDGEALAETTGYRALAPRFLHERLGLYVCPMRLDLRELNDDMREFIRRHERPHVLRSRSLHRQFHCRGDEIVRRGEAARTAWVLIDGRVGVVCEPAWSGAPPEVVRELGPGALFGERALLGEEPRTETFVALSDVELMVLEPDECRLASEIAR